MSEETTINILIADDSSAVRDYIANSLNDDCTIHEAKNGEEALQQLETNESISLVFTDMHMPMTDGSLLLKKIRASEYERIANLPVIIFTGYENTDVAKRAAHNLGATDFISKPFDSFTILDKVSEYTNLEKNISKNKQKITYDELTGLLNESSFTEYCTRTLEYADSNALETSLLCLQVTGISDVFKEHGEATSEQIIITIANHLEETLQDNEKIAHLGSGKFSIVLPETSEFKANIVGIRLQKMVANLLFEKGDSDIQIEIAIGMSGTSISGAYITLEKLTLQAEQALQMSLEQPGAHIVRYDETYEKNYVEETKNETIEPETSAGEEISAEDAAKMKEYFIDIMSGNYDKVPAYYLESMVLPLQNFLEYAYDYTEVEMKRPAGMAKREAY